MSDNESRDKLGKSLGRIPSGVAILTTQEGDAKGAMLASWFQQCSFDPPMITVAMKKGRSAEGVLKASEKFALCLLHTGQQKMLSHFGKGFKPGEDPFKGVATETKASGLPVLQDCLSYLECQVRHCYDAGDHQIFVGEVLNGDLQEEGQPMVHVRRNGFNY